MNDTERPWCAKGMTPSERALAMIPKNISPVYLHAPHVIEAIEAALAEQSHVSDKALLEEIENRDRFEDVVTRTAEALGCQEEWSNLHDHCDCVFEHIAELQGALADAAPKWQFVTAEWPLPYETVLAYWSREKMYEICYRDEFWMWRYTRTGENIRVNGVTHFQYVTVPAPPEPAKRPVGYMGDVNGPGCDPDVHG